MSANIHRNTIALLIVGIAVIFVVGEAFGDLAIYVRAACAFPSSPTTFQSKAYGQLLSKYVHDGLVDYWQIKKHPAELNTAVAELEHTRPDNLKSNAEKLAFWINAYNLLTIKQVCDDYPIHRASDLDASKHNRFIVGGRIHTRPDIEKNLLRPLAKMVDFKTIYLVSSAAMGGPPVVNHPITVEGMHKDAEAQLASLCVAPGNTNLNETDGMWRISQVFMASEDICKPAYASSFALVDAYLPEKKRVKLNEPGFQYLYFPDFDQNLNQVPPPEPAQNPVVEDPSKDSTPAAEWARTHANEQSKEVKK